MMAGGPTELHEEVRQRQRAERARHARVARRGPGRLEGRDEWRDVPHALANAAVTIPAARRREATDADATEPPSCSRTPAPQKAYEAIAVTASEGLSAQLTCRALGVSESGYYDWRGRAPSPRAVCHAWLTDVIREIHVELFGVYGPRLSVAL
jgi:hypothetical protein